MRLASTDGSGWTVETVDLQATGRRRGTKCVSADPLGDGPQLLVRRRGRPQLAAGDSNGTTYLAGWLSQGGSWPPLARAAVPLTLPSWVMVARARGWPRT